MAIKGFSTLLHSAVRTAYSTLDKYKTKIPELHQSLRLLGNERAGMMVNSTWLSLVSSGNSLDASGSDIWKLAITGHSIKKGQIIRFTSGNIQREEVQVSDVDDVNFVLLNSPLSEAPAGSETFSILQPMTPTLDSTGQLAVVEGITTVVDFLDVGTYVPSSTGDGIIPRSSSNATLMVASLAANVTKLQSVSDVGELINIYSDAARTNLICHMVLTPDEVVDVDIPAGTAIYMGAAKDVDIDDANSVIQINFIG